MQPVKLTDDQLTAVFRAAMPLAVEDRDDFLRAVAAQLSEHPDPGPGDVFRAIVAAQRQFFRPPHFTGTVGGKLGVGKYALT